MCASLIVVGIPSQVENLKGVSKGVSWITAVRTSDVKFEPTGPALGPKSGPAGLLHDLNVNCWAHVGSE